MPSETIDLDRKHVVGIVTQEGGENSHAAILARGLGIPAVTAVANATERIQSGAKLLIDGRTGHVTMAPTDAAAAEMAALKREYDVASAAAERAENLDCVTRDGVRILLMANLNCAAEVELVETHHLDGVGLFRTEFLYMDSPQAPDCDRQVAVYQPLFERLGNRPLVTRTLDLGGDKIPVFLMPHYQENPNLGLRGLRFALGEARLFATQLRCS